MAIDRRAFERCGLQRTSGCTDIGRDETAPPRGLLNRNQPLGGYAFADLQGRELPLGDPFLDAFVARYSAPAHHSPIQR